MCKSRKKSSSEANESANWHSLLEASAALYSWTSGCGEAILTIRGLCREAVVCKCVFRRSSRILLLWVQEFDVVEELVLVGSVSALEKNS